MLKTSIGVKTLLPYQKKMGVKWWPYNRVGLMPPHPQNDVFNIIGSRNVLLNSKL